MNCPWEQIYAQTFFWRSYKRFPVILQTCVWRSYKRFLFGEWRRTFSSQTFSFKSAWRRDADESKMPTVLTPSPAGPRLFTRKRVLPAASAAPASAARASAAPASAAHDPNEETAQDLVRDKQITCSSNTAW